MSKSILKINASLVPQRSKSLQLSDNYIQLLTQNTDISVIVRDLSNDIKYIDSSWIEAAFTAIENRTESQINALSLSDQLIDEIINADEIVLATPMYNFSVPANLKTYFDLIARVGVTFKYTNKGSIGLLENKQTTVIITTGGTKIHSNNDFMSPYITQMLNFIGITNISIVAADQQSVDPSKSFNMANDTLIKMAN